MVSPCVNESVDSMNTEHEIYDAETDDDAGVDDDDAGVDDDDDVAGVQEFMHKGSKYLRDPKTNDIFDYEVYMETEEAEQIGVYDPEKDEIVMDGDDDDDDDDDDDE